VEKNNFNINTWQKESNKIEHPYTVSNSYFDELSTAVLQQIQSKTITKNVEADNVYKVPTDYFKTLDVAILPKKNSTKKASWYKWTVAACIGMLISMVAWFGIIKNTETSQTSIIQMQPKNILDKTEIESFYAEDLFEKDQHFSIINNKELDNINNEEIAAYLNNEEI
jgi:hypothetical protein